MNVCSICGEENFEKQGGYVYCVACQTQSQDYHEEEYDYTEHEENERRQKSHATKSVKPKSFDGRWVSWEAFNYILYGMKNEVKKLGAPENFDEIVYKLWIVYLKKCQVIFSPKKKNKIPKLGLNFKYRDAEILYDFDFSKNLIWKKKRKRRKSCSSKTSDLSELSELSQSKKSLSLTKNKIVESDYEEHLSQSSQNMDNLTDRSLDSLGDSSESEELNKISKKTENTSYGSETLKKVFKHVLRKKDYKTFKKSYCSEKLLKKAKNVAKKDVRTPGKNKLLSIIHLALLMTGSQIQLGDLFRFIREGHLSFAKVTHFFPSDMKFPKRDVTYIESVSDTLMPTHLRQRRITSQLAYLLKVNKIRTPNMNELIERYCQDLNLPKRIAELSEKVAAKWVPPTTVPRSKTALPNYEAWAMASIIFTIKLLFGLNDRTEIFFSHLACEINRLRRNDSDDRLFVFRDWQKFIEQRKKLLTEFHYPTQEQLAGSNFLNYKEFLGMLLKESKDEYRSERFIPYSKYYIKKELLAELKQILSYLSESQNVALLEFEPSLIPQVSHTETIIRYLTQEADKFKEETSCPNFAKTLSETFLQNNFRNCDIGFAFDPKKYFKLVENNSDLRIKFDIDNEFRDPKSKRMQELLFNCPSNYWIFKYPNTRSSHLVNFKKKVLQKTPESFQWLITECARMLEMNIRDLYSELLRLEKKFKLAVEN